MPGYHPVHNPNPELPVIHPPPNLINTEGLTEGAPPTFPTNTNQQGLRGFTIPMGHGPAWEQQLRDTLHVRYQRPQPAQQAGPPPALEEQVPSGSTEPRRSSRVRQPASTHPDNVYGSMDPASRQRMDL